MSDIEPSDEDYSDEELERSFVMLQAALASLPEPAALNDEPPEQVLDGARWIHDWVNADTELAQLTDDSALTGHQTTRASVPIRRIEFQGPGVRVDIEVQPSDRGTSLTGWLSPGVPGTVEARVGSLTYRAEIAPDGAFLIDNMVRGTVLMLITTERDAMRLAPFQI